MERTEDEDLQLKYYIFEQLDLDIPEPELKKKKIDLAEWNIKGIDEQEAKKVDLVKAKAFYRVYKYKDARFNRSHQLTQSEVDDFLTLEWFRAGDLVFNTTAKTLSFFDGIALQQCATV